MDVSAKMGKFFIVFFVIVFVGNGNGAKAEVAKTRKLLGHHHHHHHRIAPVPSALPCAPPFPGSLPPIPFPAAPPFPGSIFPPCATPPSSSSMSTDDFVNFPFNYDNPTEIHSEGASPSPSPSPVLIANGG